MGLLCVLAACGPKVNEGDDDGDDTPIDARPPECEPGVQEACYTGAPGTNGVGPCHGGMRVCSDSGYWSECLDQVTPRGEICLNTTDDDCDMTIDEDTDTDGDGFSTCESDCCDNQADGCESPELVNPGAFEADGNELDDDCDGTVDNVTAAACDMGLSSSSSDAMDYARAMELCQTATEDPGDYQWGVISARFALADGSGTPAAASRSIRTAFGATSVQAGSAMAVLSTGTASTGTTAAFFQPGTDTGTSSDFPEDWLDANGGDVPNPSDCPDPLDTAANPFVANNPILLELRIRTPTNARSFRLRTNFISSEYPEWVCSPFNDFFVVLLDSSYSGTPANPDDKNLATYTAPSMAVYPVGVNLAHDNTGLFRQCTNGTAGCGYPGPTENITACANMTELASTGFQLDATGGQMYSCGSNKKVGGGTSWLQTSGNVVGGEIITLRIALWDTSDRFWDSIALIDAFEWSVEASEPGTIIIVD